MVVPLMKYTIEHSWYVRHDDCGWSCEHSHQHETDARICINAHLMHCVQPGDTPMFNHAGAIGRMKDVIINAYREDASDV